MIRKNKCIRLFTYFFNYFKFRVGIILSLYICCFYITVFFFFFLIKVQVSICPYLTRRIKAYID